MGLQQLLKKWGNRNKGLNSTSTTKKRVIEIIQLNLAINTHLKGFHTFLLKKRAFYPWQNYYNFVREQRQNDYTNSAFVVANFPYTNSNSQVDYAHKATT